MTDHCTTDGYGNAGCIGTAVHTHSTIGDLPMTGLDLVSVVATILGVLIISYALVRAVADAQELGVTLPRLGRRRRGGRIILPPARDER